jgi:hypothetical protein
MRKTLFTLALVLLPVLSLAQAFPNLLTGQTPRTVITPSGWTLTATEDFETGTCSGTGTYCNGNFTTTQFHNDGNPAHTHSLGVQQNDTRTGLSWNKFTPVGTGEFYISFYTYLDTSFRMNDEMFVMRAHWDSGNGQPGDREAILDYFQDSTGTYNSTDATLLWNIQGQPYYQNKLPSNTLTDNTNFTPITGTFNNQIEVYGRYSTVLPSVAISGTVAVNGSAHTYTRSAGSWIADGVIVGSSPHFTGFANSDNNGAGDSGGGGTSYFVTSVTDTVMTVSDLTNRMVTESASSGHTYQIDKGDGAYSLYINGVLQGFQNNMVLPGKYDFATSNTTLSVMESYSKLIWRAHVNGNCETQATAPPPYAGACASSIGNGGCGFEQIPLGWNASGQTRSAAGSGFDTAIDCSTLAGGPMPNPPAFNRYVDDIIVLTRARTAPVNTVRPAVLTASSDSCGNPQQIVKFPGYAQFTLDSGTTAACGAAGTSGQGVNSYFDLKNDPNAQWDFGAADTGMFEHQWGIKNQDGTTRYNEIKEGPMPIVVAESNNVRVKLTQAGAVRSVGLLTNTADCCMTMTKSYVFYRHGTGTVGLGASKVFTKTTINYDNGDSQTPLTTAGTSTGINYYDKMGYWKVSGEVNNQTNPSPCGSTLQPFTLSPWNIIWPGTQLDNTLKTYILYAPVDANDTHATEFLPAAPCTSPGNINPGPENTTSGQPQPGTIMLCNGATSLGCTSQSASPAIVRANFLQIENEQTCSFMSIGTQNYFLGGLRTYCALASQTFPTNTPRSWTSVGYIGDNGVTSDGSATSYVTEYKSPPTITFVTGNTAAFDATEGYWTMVAATNTVSFSANAVMHSPAFNISSFSNAAPTQITVGGTTLAKDSGFVAVKTDSTHLLIQVLSDIPSGTNININGGLPTLTISPLTASIPKSGSQQFTASISGATYSVNGSCTGAVTSAGVFTATTTAETCTVTATSGSNIATASITVSSLTVSPATISMQVGATQQFTSNFTSSWSASCGTISGSGLYTAPSTNGSCTITATAVNGGTTATATATISGAVTTIPLSLSPTSWNYGTVAISTPATKVFTATNVGTGSVTPTVTLTGSGTFSKTADTCNATPVAGSGTCSITIRFLSAAAGNFAGNLQVTDTASGNTNIPLQAAVAPVVVVSISPKSATLPKLGSQQFSSNVAVTWTTNVTGASITSGGFFTAGNTATTGTVTGTSAPSSDVANVTIQSVALSPLSVTIRVSAKQQFTANFPVTWSAACGTITTAGLYTAPSAPTSCIITGTATNGGSTGTAAVTVVPITANNSGGKQNGKNNGKFN